MEQNQIFQSTYHETRNCKSTKIYANGYLAKYPTRRQLLYEDYQYQVRQESALVKAFSKLQERLESQEAEKEAEREEHRHQMEEMMKEREADREALGQEFMSMMQATHVQASIQQENQDSIPPQTQLVATTATGTSTSRTTRNSAANKTQTGQNKEGDTRLRFHL
uniref:Uncharacterized protein n=1 Tax=Setaria viridis TaxID=4556 RepID=A0A4U6UUE3_SETVI|nr:hypothetical protein SEVIR_5G187300v2 [Setaria viridis]